MKTTNEIIRELQEFIPVTDDPRTSNELLLDEILKDFYKNEDAKLIIPALFELLEKYPEADFGVPGPIIHTLESFEDDYEEHLFLSIKRKPVPMTILMLNRIVNASENLSERTKYVQTLYYLSTMSDIDPTAKRDAHKFYKYQLSKESR
ncbi:MAG: hypothetical protein AAF632_12630 [Bacteroidota bacterium]